MIYGSVCSGIEAATQAWHPLGWTPAFFSEIDNFPAAVLAHHYGSNMPGKPLTANGVPNLGDMTKFKEWPDYAIDLLVGGTPCQSFSVAGLRKGLADPRGNLMLTYLALLDRYRPRWCVWENVPGVLSSNGGRDFGSFLGGLGKLGYGFAYRVLDAQYVRTCRYRGAVPQRRRRVFVVGHLGDWRRAAAVLFDRESLSGDPPPRREAGQGAATTLSARTRGGGWLGTDFDCDGGLIASTGDVAHCLNAGGMGRIDYESETMVATASGHVPGVRKASALEGVMREALYAGQEGRESHLTDRSGADSGEGGDGVWAVRRLTPRLRECHRLQGFPDGFCNIPWRGKDHAPDGPQYKALGNSMAVNVMEWIGRRIDLVDAMPFLMPRPRPARGRCASARSGP